MILRERQANVAIYLLEKIPGQMKTSLALPLQTLQKNQNKTKMRINIWLRFLDLKTGNPEDRGAKPQGRNQTTQTVGSSSRQRVRVI